jgi:hypothetical protein
MQRRAHPTHRRITNIVAAPLGILGALSALVMLCTKENGPQAVLHTVAIAGFGTGGLGCLFWLVLRSTVLRCPQCRSIIWNPRRSPFGKSKRFLCKRCKVEWDSGIVDEGGAP